MNKTTKASIATAAGIVLLLGGGGSLAYWTDQQSAGSGTQTVSAGNLQVTPVGTGQWTKGFYNAGGTQVTAPAVVANLTNVRLVPGNRLVFTQQFTISAAGDDLYFTVNPTNGAIAAGGAAANQVALAAILNTGTNSVVTLDKTGLTSGSISASTTSGVYKVSGSSTGTVAFTWTINWPFGTAGSPTTDNPAKLGSVTLTNGAVTVTQVDAP